MCGINIILSDIPEVCAVEAMIQNCQQAQNVLLVDMVSNQSREKKDKHKLVYCGFLTCFLLCQINSINKNNFNTSSSTLFD